VYIERLKRRGQTGQKKKADVHKAPHLVTPHENTIYTTSFPSSWLVEMDTNVFKIKFLFSSKTPDRD
jgi:hypothetical protein